MSLINAKVVAVVVGASVLAGTGAYVTQQRQIDRLQEQNRQLVTQQRKLKAEPQSALVMAPAEEVELQQLRKNARELAQLRNEVGRLRQERQSPTQAGAKATAVPAPGQDLNNKIIYLAGEFLHPGPWEFPTGFSPTVVTVILRSGGTTKNADLTHVRVLRAVGGQRTTEVVNAQAILDGDTSQPDMPLNPDDIMTVPSSANATNVIRNGKNPGVRKKLP